MNYILFRNADGNTGYYIDAPSVGWKYAHGNTGHHFEPGGHLKTAHYIMRSSYEKRSPLVSN
ncbi:hypothetical protein [Bacillus pseudomycoides]|uniref:hypothetical protein n=1 Tax=Bacillus pseudomycoides TaxID=64104 RepID=UPI000BEC9428|nr:hypothetical protein [Bacillus pseudomycoides]PDY45544.1 hypothetical protein CON79_19705 [Bacillus pseudomycoides]PHB48299.1 hypothetical protein COE83_09590 [Bacillus pseudomycoides]